MVALFIGCLRQRDIELYLANLEEKGRLFARLGVPFDEVILSMHLFEETCLEKILESYPERARVKDMALAMEELHRMGLAVLASSYFEDVRKDMQGMSESLKEENDSLRRELLETRETFFASTKRDLSSIELVVSSVNRKLRNRVYQLVRCNKISEALDHEPHLPRLLKTTHQHLTRLCPPNSDVYFGLFGEDRRTVNLYNLSSAEAHECDLVETFYYSELPEMFQRALYDDTRRATHFTGFQHIPRVIQELVRFRGYQEFIVLPIRQFQEAAGFILLSCSTEGFFSKSNDRFFQRIGQSISKSLMNAILFARCKKKDEFTSLLQAMSVKSLKEQPLETTLDFCLGSLIDLLGAERSSVMGYDNKKRELRVMAAKGYRVYPIGGMSVKWGEGVAGLALKESRVISIPKMKESHANGNGMVRLMKGDSLPEQKVKSLLCVPIIRMRRPLGVINVSTINFYKNFEPSEIDMANQVVGRISDVMKDITID